MWRAVLGFAGDREIASDAVAEAFAQALRRGDALRSPIAWIWRTAFRVAAGELKLRRSQPTAVVEGAYELGADSSELVGALSRLPKRLRAAVVLHHIADYPVREVAQVLGSSEAAVRMRLTRGRRRLRELLEERDA